jgi:hypothetical protein
MAAPIAQLFFNFPLIQFGSTGYMLPLWALPLTALLGFLIFTLTLHLARAIGRLHGKYARAIFLRE